MTTARTRPGLVREALLDGRTFWEAAGARGFLQQWMLSVRNTHPICIMCRSHRLSPFTKREQFFEGLFLLISGFIGLVIIQEVLIVKNMFNNDCDLFQDGVYPELSPDTRSGFAPGRPQVSNETLRIVCPPLDSVELPSFLDSQADISTFAISSLASLLLTAAMTTVSAVLACIRAPCLRKWVDWPLKDSHGLHPSRSPHRRELCSAHGACSCLAPCFGRQGCCGDDGQCSRCASACTFRGISLLVRGVAVIVLIALSSSLILLRYRAGIEGGAIAADFTGFISAYIQSLTLNYLGTSLFSFAPLWLCANYCGAYIGWDDFPLPFRTVIASNSVPFPEEAVAEIVVRAPRTNRRVPLGPGKRGVAAVYGEFVGGDVKAAVDAAVARFDAEVASRDRFGRVLRAGRAVGGAVRRGLTTLNPLTGDGDDDAALLPPSIVTKPPARVNSGVELASMQSSADSAASPVEPLAPATPPAQQGAAGAPAPLLPTGAAAAAEGIAEP